MKTEKDLKPLVDLDILQYRCGFAADAQLKNEYKEQHPGAPDEEIAEALANTEYTSLALQNVKTVMEAVLERFNGDYKAYIQDGPCFRYDIATLRPYKGNRDKSHKPKYYSEIKDYLVEHWNAIPVSHLESDDAIGIEQFRNTDKYSVIVSIDKDMMCIPGWHYNWVKGEMQYQTLSDANLFHFWQMLVGDTTDNIPGINQIGPVKASKIIKECNRDLDCVRKAVQEMYRKQYGENWEAAYNEVSRLLYILRRPEELDNGSPFIW